MLYFIKGLVRSQLRFSDSNLCCQSVLQLLVNHLLRLRTGSRHNATLIGKQAASGPVSVSDGMLAAARWMEANDLASFTSDSKLVLLDDALETQLTLNKPLVVQDPADRADQSMWSLRKQLKQRGWLSDASKP